MRIARFALFLRGMDVACAPYMGIADRTFVAWTATFYAALGGTALAGCGGTVTQDGVPGRGEGGGAPSSGGTTLTGGATALGGHTAVIAGQGAVPGRGEGGGASSSGGATSTGGTTAGQGGGGNARLRRPRAAG